MNKPISAWYRASGIRRFHTLPALFPDSVGQHTGGVVFLVAYLMGEDYPDDVRLSTIYAALIHDLAEYKTGDIPSPTKSALGSTAVDTMEREYLSSMRVFTDNVEKLTWKPAISLADAGDGMIRSAIECRSGNKCFEEAYENYGTYFRTRLAEIESGEEVTSAFLRRAWGVHNYAQHVKEGRAL